MSNEIYDSIVNHKIVAIIRGVKPDKMLSTINALYAGGIKLIEVTFDQNNPHETRTSLELIAENYSDKIILGAGTVITVEQVEIAAECGAHYVISPNIDVSVITKTKELGKISIPGALTPSEAVTGYNAGADFVKLFPLGVMGVDYLKALFGPLSYIPFIAVGGVNIHNIRDFFAAGAVGVGIGGNLVNVHAIHGGEYYKLTEVAQQYIEKVNK
jgi:2-dehydro-3-deoxyphosphogluconate aldolase/(4S)-4-hydroxy-2-oxoglutarate aldolase